MIPSDDADESLSRADLARTILGERPSLTVDALAEPFGNSPGRSGCGVLSGSPTQATRGLLILRRMAHADQSSRRHR